MFNAFVYFAVAPLFDHYEAAAMLTMRHVIELKDVIRWSAVFRAAGLNENTMRSAMHHGRELRPGEAEAIAEALRKRGVYLHPVQQRLDFPQ